MDGLTAMHVAHGEFERRLRTVRSDQWSAQTPCDEWTVRDLVIHNVLVAQWYALLVRGATMGEVRRTSPQDADRLGEDPLAAFVGTAASVEAAFEEPGALDRSCHFVWDGTRGEQLLEYRILDSAIHAWDLG